MVTASPKDDVRVIAPNLKRRLSGVTSTIIQLVPLQNRLGQKVVTFGPGLPESLPSIGLFGLARLWTKPATGTHRVWHARRNTEMLLGLFLRNILCMRLKLLFTSASQRKHSGWTRFLIRQMDGVVATSTRTAAYLTVPNSVVYHGIDTERFAPPPDKAAACRALGLDPALRHIGCFGRIRRQKGTDLFVDSMIRLLPQRPDWVALIAGRTLPKYAAFEAELRQRIAEAGLTDRIRFVGEHTNIHDWYKALDLFVAPQRWEGFGLTPLEAMACGVPVVATDVGAFEELVVEHETGDVIARDNLDLMATTVGAWMDDDDRRARACVAARNHAVNRFALEGEALRLGALYSALAGD